MVPGGARRLDWHVLLPGPREPASDHWLLLGPDPDLSRHAVELELAGSVASVIDDAEPADVVGLLHSAATSLDDAIRSLAPGGYLYWEIDRRSLRTIAMSPGRACRRVRAAGLEPCGVYLVGHGWARPSRFLPAQPGGPIGWYLETSSRWTRQVRGTLWRILHGRTVASWLARLLAPRFSLIAAARDAEPATTPAVLRHPSLPASIQSTVVPPILVTGGQEPWARLTLLAFAEDGSEPSTILKVGRLAAYDEATRNEHAVLVELRGKLDEATRSTLPEPIALIEVGHRPVSVQGVLRGTSAVARMRGRSRSRTTAWHDLSRTADWLIALERQTARARVTPGSPDWIAHVDDPLSRFTDAFGHRPEVDRLFRDLVDQVAAAGAELPIVCCHRDLGPWNVLVEGDSVRVVDWEVARDGPALTDLVYASIHWTFEAHGLANEADRRRELRRLFFGQETGDAGPSSVRAAIRRSIDALRIDQRLVPPLVVLTMVGQALDRFDRLARVGRADRRPWLDNRYAGYVAELASFDDGWIGDPTRCVGRA